MFHTVDLLLAPGHGAVGAEVAADALHLMPAVEGHAVVLEVVQPSVHLHPAGGEGVRGEHIVAAVPVLDPARGGGGVILRGLRGLLGLVGGICGIRLGGSDHAYDQAQEQQHRRRGIQGDGQGLHAVGILSSALAGLADVLDVAMGLIHRQGQHRQTQKTQDPGPGIAAGGFLRLGTAAAEHETARQQGPKHTLVFHGYSSIIRGYCVQYTIIRPVWQGQKR